MTVGAMWYAPDHTLCGIGVENGCSVPYQSRLNSLIDIDSLLAWIVTTLQARGTCPGDLNNIFQRNRNISKHLSVDADFPVDFICPQISDPRTLATIITEGQSNRNPFSNRNP